MNAILSQLRKLTLFVLLQIPLQRYKDMCIFSSVLCGSFFESTGLDFIPCILLSTAGVRQSFMLSIRLAINFHLTYLQFAAIEGCFELTFDSCNFKF